MVKGRMKVEENPLPGEPAKTPQFDTTGSGDFENISPLNPLPVVVDGIVQDMKEIQKTQNDILEKMVRPPELFYIDDFKVPAGEFRQYSEFNPDLKLGTLDDMRMYGYFYFGAQSYSGNHSYRIMVRQKPFGTGGSVAIDNQSDESGTTRKIEKTQIAFHNLSFRVYNDSDAEQTYTLSVGFWPL